MFVNRTVCVLSMTTPDFPDWSGNFARQLQKLRRTAAPTLHQFELLFAAWFPHWRLAQQDEGPHSRERRWNRRFGLLDVLMAGGSSLAPPAARRSDRPRLAVKNADHPLPPNEDSPYCQARGSLPLERLQEIHDGLCTEAMKGLAARICGADATSWSSTALRSPLRIPQPTKRLSRSSRCRSQAVASLSCAWWPCSVWPPACSPPGPPGLGPQHEVGLLQTLWDSLRRGGFAGRSRIR